MSVPIHREFFRVFALGIRFQLQVRSNAFFPEPQSIQLSNGFFQSFNKYLLIPTLYWAWCWESILIL